MSQSTLAQCDQKVVELLTKVHQRLNGRFPFIQQSRELSAEQNELLCQIGNETVNHKILVAAMAIDTYTEHIAQIFAQTDTLLETLSICLSCAQKMKNELGTNNVTNQMSIAFENLYNSIINMTQSASLFNPNSPYLQLYRSVISNEIQHLAQNIYSTLKQQNDQLKQRLKLNDQKIMDLEIKLTRILQQYDGSDNPGGIENTMKSYELKDELEKKQAEIQKMNEEFCYEIEKYNIVYETLKRELAEYKSYEPNVETVQLIEKLETQIVVLREEKEREQMINEELRRRLQILSQNSYNPPQVFKKNFYYDRPSYNSNDAYQTYQEEDYYVGNVDMQQYDTENDSEQLQIRIPYQNSRVAPANRGYNEWNTALKNSYRY